MRKILIHAATITLAITALNLSAYGQQNPNIATLPTLDGSVQFPQRKQQIVRHTIRVNIPQESKAITQINISIPPGLNVRNDITIHDESGQKLTANTSVDGNIVTINFPEPISPVAMLEIDMNRVKILGAPNTFPYRVKAKLVGLQPELDLGVAEIRTSR